MAGPTLVPAPSPDEGAGLSLSHGIVVDQHGGTLGVESEPGT